jgi:hypothetical protein
MEIEKLINTVNGYFISRILNGDFNVIEVNRYRVTITVLSYKFSFWIANGESFFRSDWGGDNHSFMDLNINEQERKMMYDVIMNRAKSYYTEMCLGEKLKKLKEIQEEIDLMKNY